MSNEERWALGEACEQGDLKRVEALVNPPSNPTAEVLNYGLSTAASEGHSAVVSFLFDKGAEMTAATTVLAANGHSPAVFQVFLDHGWDINSNGCSRGPILELVVDDETMVKWFLDHGADPNIHSHRDRSPLDTAANCSSPAVIDLLLEHGAKLENSNALHAAAEGPSGIPMMAHLLDRGFNINAFHHQHNPEYFERMKLHAFGTPLHAAARTGIKDRVQFLLDRGADPEIKNTKGFTPAEWAKRYRSDDCAEIFDKIPDPV